MFSTSQVTLIHISFQIIYILLPFFYFIFQFFDVIEVVIIHKIIWPDFSFKKYEKIKIKIKHPFVVFSTYWIFAILKTIHPKTNINHYITLCGYIYILRQAFVGLYVLFVWMLSCLAPPKLCSPIVHFWQPQKAPNEAMYMFVVSHFLEQ